MSVLQVMVPEQHAAQSQQWILQQTASGPVAQQVISIGYPAQMQPQDPSPVELPVSQMEDIDADGLDLEEFRDLVKDFKEKRIGLGLNQTQAGLDLHTAASGHAYSQSFVCRLERLDVTLRQAKQVMPMLKKWLANADQKYCVLTPEGTLVPVCYSSFVAAQAATKIRYVVERSLDLFGCDTKYSHSRPL
jgi:hypothetical protein